MLFLMHDETGSHFLMGYSIMLMSYVMQCCIEAMHEIHEIKAWNTVTNRKCHTVSSHIRRTKSVARSSEVCFQRDQHG